MSNNVYESLFKQWATVGKLVLDGKRDPKVVSDCLQNIIQEPAERPVVTSVQPMLYKASDTDLDVWIGHTERFAAKYLGVTVHLRKQFAIPAELPWKSVIPVFDPGNLTNRDVVKKALTGLNLDVYEEEDVMEYSGSKATKEPTLHFIENSITPNTDTMGKSPDDLRQGGKLYLRLRGYGLAFAVYHSATQKWLDPETWTWFPEDRLSDGYVAFGGWDPDRRRVRFRWYNPDYRYSNCGARVALPVSLRDS